MQNFLGYFLSEFHVFLLVSYHVDIELLAYLGFQGIMLLLLFVLFLNIHALFFLLPFQFLSYLMSHL